MKNPIVSIIIPTYSASENVLALVLKSIAAQVGDKRNYELIIADNQGTQKTFQLARKYKARFIKVPGVPPQVCLQRNLGAKIAKGQYLFFLDHDVELSKTLISNFVKLAEKAKDIDAWYIPYKIVGRGNLLTKVRNFEEEFYRNSVVAAARIIKREVFWKTEDQFDLKLNAGPADWDFDIQLRLLGAKFSYIKDYVYHHEEGLNLFNFTTKKTIYAKGGEIYKEKWQEKNLKMYNEYVKKQYDPVYRLLGIFIEKGKWQRLLPGLPLYFLFLLIKISMGVNYSVYNLKKGGLKFF